MKKSIKTGVCKAITTIACAAFMFAGMLGFSSISAKAATTRNVTIDLRNGRTISFNNVDYNNPTKDFVDEYILAMIMCSYDSNARNAVNTCTKTFTSVLSTNPYQGITMTQTTDNAISMKALEGSIGTGKYVLNKNILMQYPDVFDLDKDELEKEAMRFMTFS